MDSIKKILKMGSGCISQQKVTKVHGQPWKVDHLREARGSEVLRETHFILREAQIAEEYGTVTILDQKLLFSTQKHLFKPNNIYTTVIKHIHD
jgi:hypothetical protein